MRNINKIMGNLNLKRIQSYFYNSDTRTASARRNSLKMLVNKGLSVILSLCFLPLFLTCFDKLEYGIWATIHSIINWFGFFDIGLGQGLRNKLAEAIASKDYKLGKIYISTTYFFVSLIFLTIILLFVLVYPFMDWSSLISAPDNMKEEVNILFLISFVSILLTFIVRNIVFVLYALQKPSIVSDMNLVTQILSLISVWIAINIFKISNLIPFVFIMTVIPIIIYLLYSYWIFKKKYPLLSPSISCIKLKYGKVLLSLGGVFFLIQISNIVLVHSNNFIISNILGPSEVAEFQVAFQYLSILTSIFFILTTPYWSAVTEAFSKKEYTWISKSVKELHLYFLGMVCCAIIMVLFSDLIFNLWIGDKIIVRKFVVFLLATYTLIQAFGNIYISIINGIGNIKIQFIVVFICSLIYLPLAIFMTEKFAILGLLFSMIIISVFTTIWAPIQYHYIINRINNDTSEN